MQNSSRYRVIMMLKTCNVSRTSSFMSRRSESANVITFLYKVMVCTLPCHANLYLYSRMRIGTNAQTRSARNANTADPEVEMRDSVKGNPPPNLERIKLFTASTLAVYLGYACKRQFRTASSRLEQTLYVAKRVR